MKHSLKWFTQKCWFIQERKKGLNYDYDWITESVAQLNWFVMSELLNNLSTLNRTTMGVWSLESGLG